MERKETKTVLICDSCGRESNSPLSICPICGRECCYTCSHQLYDVWHLGICKVCLNDETINAYFMDAAKHWKHERSNTLQGILQDLMKSKTTNNK